MATPTTGAIALCIVAGLLGESACGGGSVATPVTTPTLDAGDAGSAVPDVVATPDQLSTQALDGADAPPEADAANDGPPPSLSAMLVRDWFSNTSQVGNCIDVASWYSFGADGTVVNRDIDDNSCTHVPRLIARFTGTYSLVGQVLEMTLNGRGIGRPYLSMELPTEPVTRRLERFPIVGGTLTSPPIGAGHRALDDAAYTSSDGAHFESERTIELDGASGTRLFEQKILFKVTVDPPLPLAVGTPCRVDLDFSLSLLDAAAVTKMENDSFHMTYMAIIRATEAGWMRIMPLPLDSLDNEARNATWTGMLESAGLSSNHSMRFARTFGMNFVYYLGHPVGDPHILTQSLPQIGRWYEATRPPPVQ